jgi:hypothetical protein
VAEYLAAGPQLRDLWLAGQETHPRGAALVTAAVDCRRAGYIAPLPKALLVELHGHYLPAGPRSRVETPEAAWTWATQVWRHTTALLEPTSSDEDSVIVFDYLVDHVQRTTPIDHDPPEAVLLTALTYADATTATAIGTHAQQRGRYALAYAAHSHALSAHTTNAGTEHPDTLTSRNNLATVLHDQGKLDEAEQEHRATLDTRMRVLGTEHPNTLTSRNNLATVLRDQGKLNEAAEIQPRDNAG